MSQTAITKAFEKWKARQGESGEPVLLDEFIFASVPGLDPSKPVDRSEGIPPDAQIVHRQAITRKGVVNENAVVHSVVLGADVGDFSFNWIGLVNKASGVLAMIVHAPVQQKLKTRDGQQGNVLTRSFLMEYSGAQQETGITTPAETWQIDFTARMAAMDERQRLENVDIYGAGAFFGDGWLVAKTGSQYFVTRGAGYVAGLRAQLDANQDISLSAKPVKVWLDVCWTGTLASVWGVQSKITVAADHADYEQNGVQHYVFALASIDADGAITDLRPKGSLADQEGAKSFLRIDADLAEIAARGEEAQARARDNLKVLSRKDTDDLYLSKKDGGTVSGAVKIVHTLSISAAPSGVFADPNMATVNIGDSDTGLVYPGDGMLDVYANNTRVFRWDLNAGVNFSEVTFRSKGEIQTQAVNGFRIAYSNRGAFTRFDGSNWYLLFTKDNDPYGTFNDLRPIKVSYTSGVVTLEHGLTVNANILVDWSGRGHRFQENGDIVEVNGSSSIFRGFWGATTLGVALRNITNRADDAWNKANDAQLNRVQSFRLVGLGEANNGNNDNAYAVAPDGTVVVAIQQKGNWTAVRYRYPQILVNGNWYNVGVA